jgi:glycosyltransferase involved in cell wall biosynthesis
VCLSSQRWNAPLPTNRQQVMARAAGWGHRVLFVETADFVAKHLLDRRRPRPADRPDLDGVDVRKLVNMVPYSQRYGVANSINFRLGGTATRRVARSLEHPRVLWIYDPRGVAAIGTYGEDLVVYDCVDDYGEQAGPSRRARELVSRLDRAAGARADLVFTTTERLRERHERPQGGVHLVPNVGDFDHFSPAADRSLADPELASLPRPILGFAGNINPTKVDLALIEHVAAAFPAATVLLVGPVHESLAEPLGALIARCPNIHWTGLRSYASLPSAVAAFDVALVPYASNDYTRSVFPLKVYEYLAAGKPVVAAGVPSIAALGPHVALAEDAESFSAAVAAALAAGDTGKESRMAVAAANTWEHRAQSLLALIEQELRRAHPRRD